MKKEMKFLVLPNSDHVTCHIAEERGSSFDLPLQCLWTNNFQKLQAIWLSMAHPWLCTWLYGLFWNVLLRMCCQNERKMKKWHRFFNCESHSFPLDAIIYPSFLELYFFLLRESFLNDCRHHSHPLLYSYHLTSLLIIRYRFAGLWLFVVTYHQPIKSE